MVIILISYFFGFSIVILGFIGILWFVTFIMNKLLGVNVQKIAETPGKKADLWGQRFFMVLFLCSLPFFELSRLKWYLIIFSSLLLGFQSFLEWKYMKDPKQYITTLVFWGVLLIILFNFDRLKDYFFTF
ncbi:DUF4181 domain-containing protein [Oceanobacillus halophilus]|uniref:DUF4181 domain-containing protein n=1 Tax=Oceanobacillus halophilus TaxID=930130 RepID=A0A494ZU79_9BACI|nr:DUF4181 domain-containing protein [Oceanobacillus halophilus]RKQ29347.1 DUF4181 domain-containing protein [Oceanobacillus halophilus]